MSMWVGSQNGQLDDVGRVTQGFYSIKTGGYYSTHYQLYYDSGIGFLYLTYNESNNTMVLHNCTSSGAHLSVYGHGTFGNPTGAEDEWSGRTLSTPYTLDSSTTPDDPYAPDVLQYITNMPVFDPSSATFDNDVKKYLETGDKSGALNKDSLDFSSIETKIYLDGSTPPNITVTWNVENGDIPDHINVVIYSTPTYGAEEGKIELSRKLYPWNDKSVAFTWGSLENLMYGGEVTNIIIETNNRPTADNIAQAIISGDGKSFSPSEKTLSADGKNSMQVIVGEVPEEEENSDSEETEKSEADEKEENTNVNTASLLTRTYQLTREQLQSLGNFLWGDSFLNNIKLINNSPIENVVSVKAIPCDFLTEASTNIVLGNVATTVQGNPVTNNYIKKTIGTVKVARQDNSFIDYEDCDILLYLPLIGTITDLNPREVMGYTITLKYCYDAITGDVIAEIFNNRAGKENIIGIYRGNCGVDIPLTSSNRAQVEAGYISDTISGVASVVSKNPLGVVNAGMSALTRMHTSHSTGSVSGATAQGLPNKAYLTIITSLPQKVTKVFRHTYGRVCCNNHKLGDLNGYTMCDDKIDLSSISCTETEKEELRSLLATGVYL